MAAKLVNTMRNFKNISRKGRESRSGAALLVCLFVVFMTVMLLVQILDSMTLNLSVLRNSLDYQRAVYLANAAIHEVAATLESDPTWRGVVTDGAFPNHDTYTATAVDGPIINTVAVTASGVSGDIQRNLTALIEL